MLGASLFCLFLNAGQTLEAAESKEVSKKKVVAVLRQIPDVYGLTDGASLNGGNFESVFRLLGADLRTRVQEYQDAALAGRLSSGDKGKEEDKSDVSGTTERMIMPGILGYAELFLLEKLGRYDLSTLYIDRFSDNFQRIYLQFNNKRFDERDMSAFKYLFSENYGRFYMKSLFWNIDFKKDYRDFINRCDQSFDLEDIRVQINGQDMSYKNSVSQYWNASNWGSGQNSGEKFTLYSQPQEYAQRHIVTEKQIKLVTHQGRGAQATNNCGLHAIINGGLLLDSRPDEEFVQNKDAQIDQMRRSLVEKLKDPELNFSEEELRKKKEEALTGNLAEEDMMYLKGTLRSVLLDYPKIADISQSKKEKITEQWQKNFDAQMRRFCEGKIGVKILFLFNAADYNLDADTLETDKKRDIKKFIQMLYAKFNQSKQAHWIAVMFEKTAEIRDFKGINRYHIKTTLADSLAGGHYAAATFLELFFLQQLKKYEDEQDRESKK